jgi:hypothetical protein
LRGCCAKTSRACARGASCCTGCAEQSQSHWQQLLVGSSTCVLACCGRIELCFVLPRLGHLSPRPRGSKHVIFECGAGGQRGVGRGCNLCNTILFEIFQRGDENTPVNAVNRRNAHHNNVISGCGIARPRGPAGDTWRSHTPHGALCYQQAAASAAAAQRPAARKWCCCCGGSQRCSSVPMRRRTPRGSAAVAAEAAHAPTTDSLTAAAAACVAGDGRCQGS